MEFYQNLYTIHDIDKNLKHYFLNNIPKVDEEDNEILDSPLTYDECLLAINQMNNNKTPGNDGLPAEFYKTFFHIFGKDFVKTINKAMSNSTLPKTMKLGFITLICKNQNGRESLKNWRPISLLCTDYKIVSKVLANRLKSVLENLIDLDQTCSVPGRTNLDNCHLLRNLVDYAIQKETELRIINFDLEKAFDKISHQYLISVLKNFGFGQHFIKMISLLYKDVSSSVIVNGHISNSFPYQRGVRQGCCRSPLLFVLCIEPLAIKIRSDNSIRGISLPVTGELLKKISICRRYVGILDR